MGKLFVDTRTEKRTGLPIGRLIGRSPGLRDKILRTCVQSIPARCAPPTNAGWVDRLMRNARRVGIELDPGGQRGSSTGVHVWVYSWVSATSTRGMDRSGQPPAHRIGGTKRARTCDQLAVPLQRTPRHASPCEPGPSCHRVTSRGNHSFAALRKGPPDVGLPTFRANPSTQEGILADDKGKVTTAQ